MILVLGETRSLTPQEQTFLSNKGYYFTKVITTEYACNFGYLEGNDIKIKHIKVPAGFLFDGSTMSPDLGSSYVFHDYLYATHEFFTGQECTREEADGIMIDIMKREGHYLLAPLAKFVFWWNPFGKVDDAWNTSGERGPVFYQDVF